MSICVAHVRLFDYNEIPLERTKAAFLLVVFCSSGRACTVITNVVVVVVVVAHCFMLRAVAVLG